MSFSGKKDSMSYVLLVLCRRIPMSFVFFVLYREFLPVSIVLWRRHIRHNQTVRQAVEYCTIYLNPHVGGNGYNTCVRIACMRNVYVGMPRSGSLSKVVSHL